MASFSSSYTRSIQDKTVVFTLPPGSCATYTDFQPVLKAAVKGTIMCFGPVGSGNVWHLTLRNLEDVQPVLDLGNFSIADNIHVQNSKLTDAHFTGILYWLPHWVPDKDVCDSIAKLLSNNKIICQDINIPVAGFRRCLSTQRKIQSLVDLKSLPYFINIESNDCTYRTFLFVPGKQPLCFTCGSFYHKKNECVNIRDQENESEINDID